MNIYPTIVKTKVLSDGSHKIRLAVSHRCQTRYIPTRYTVPSESNLNKRGDVVGIADAANINRSLRKQIEKAYEICESIENINLLSCSQLVDVIQNGGFERPVTFKDVCALWLVGKEVKCKATSVDIYKTAIKVFEEFKGPDFVMSSLSPTIVDAYHLFLKNKKGYSNVSIRIKMGTFKCIVQFAMNRGYVKYRVNPFIDMDMPPVSKRDIALTVPQFRKLLYYRPKYKGQKAAWALFHLSFYMCGMNIADLVRIDFKKDVARFVRAKTESRRTDDVMTEFTIQPEAKYFFGFLESNNGFLSKKYVRLCNSQTLRKISQSVFKEDVRLMNYSARKTFAQAAADLEVPDSIIEYCLGDVNNTSVISYYRRVTREMADKAIRKVFDYVH